MKEKKSDTQYGVWVYSACFDVLWLWFCGCVCWGAGGGGWVVGWGRLREQRRRQVSTATQGPETCMLYICMSCTHTHTHSLTYRHTCFFYVKVYLLEYISLCIQVSTTTRGAHTLHIYIYIYRYIISYEKRILIRWHVFLMKTYIY
jgi:hypothetical protein